MEVSLDTTFLTKNVRYSVELEAVSLEQKRIKVAFDVVAEIEPRLHFSQIPEVIDPSKDGTVELRVENISGIPLKITSLASANNDYRITNELLPSAEPGQTLTITLAYHAQTAPRGAAVFFQTAQPVMATSQVTVPLRINLPVEASSGYTKEQLDRIRAGAK